ncbi:MAG: hypothetical protein QOJ32_2329 [Frankiaceae bacterium]|nr:hypothetical protein [Frankiaceae bacterium]
MSENVDLLDSVLDKTSTLIAAVPPDAAHRPTPCPEFDVDALVSHLTQWLTTFATSLEGDPPPTPAAEAGGWPAIEAEQFALAGRHAVSAFRNGADGRPVTLMGGPIPGSMVLGMMLMEYIGHGWDLATATGQPLPFGEAEAEAALAAGRQFLTPEYRGPDKSFGDEVPVPDDAPAVERLIGFLGRDPYASPRP